MTSFKRGLLSALAVAALAGRAAAQNVDISFTPNVARAITTSFAGSLNFGAIQVGSASLTSAGIVVTNAGTVATSLSVAVSSPALDQGLGPGNVPLNQDWALSTSTFTGVDTFALFAVFQSSKPLNGQYADVLHRVPDTGATQQVQCASDFPNVSPVERFKGGQSGVRVPAGGGAISLWLNLYPPTRSSNLKAKKLTVTITTGACD